jgi:Uncharacterized protein conserved in bacteria (DUF2213)
MSDLLHQYDFAPVSKAIVLPNGYLHFVAPFFRVTDNSEKGIRYFDRQGKPYYQRVTKELLERTAHTFKGLPITDNHPPQFLDTKNTKDYSRGLTGTSNLATHVTDKFAWLIGTAYDEALIEGIKNKQKREISPGYLAALKDTDQADIKDRTDMIGNHIAFVSRGRNGSLVALNLDSSDEAWQFCADVEQFDSDYIQQVKKEIEYLPREFLDLTYVKEKTGLVNLDLYSKPQETTAMKTAQLVVDHQVLSFQSDSVEDITAAFKKLQATLASLEAEKATLQTQKDTADRAVETEKGKAEALKSELTSATEKLNKQNDAANSSNSRSEAVKLAVSMLKVLPPLLAVEPKFELTEDSLDETKLKQRFLCAVMPEKKEEIQAWNLDSATTEGAKNLGKLEALYEIKSGEVQQKQADSQQKKPYSSLDELKLLLTNGVVKNQDSGNSDSTSIDKSRKEYVSTVDSNF